MSLLREYVTVALKQEGAPLSEYGDRGVLLALDALRVGVSITLKELSTDAATRMVWTEAAKLLENERAQRLALALRRPGARLEDDEPDAGLEQATAWALEAQDARLGGAA